MKNKELIKVEKPEGINLYNTYSIEIKNIGNAEINFYLPNDFYTGDLENEIYIAISKLVSLLKKK